MRKESFQLLSQTYVVCEGHEQKEPAGCSHFSPVQYSKIEIFGFLAYHESTFWVSPTG